VKVLAIALLAAVSCAPVAQAATKRGDAAYYSWLQGCLKALRGDVSRIAVSSEVAARKFVNDDYSLGAWGDPAIGSEFGGRAGGLMPVVSVDASKADKTIVLATLSEGTFDANLPQLVELSKRDNYIVLIARKSIIEKAKAAGLRFDAAVDNHASEHNGIMQVDGKWMVPTDPTANIAALWTWTAEFVSACSRLGKLPTVWQSIRVPGSAERNPKFYGQRYVAEKPAPIPQRKLGLEYIDGVSELLTQIHKTDSGSIGKAGALAAEAHKVNGNLYVVFTGHALQTQLPCDGDPGLFRLYAGGPINKGDFLLGVGYDMLVRDPTFKSARDAAVASGATRAWSFTSYSAEDVKSVPAGDIYIDQLWALGDAIVTVPGYDVKILPPSGVIGEYLFWTINAEMLK
jgi:uncharacterized phosphosugar-binding protein